MQWIEPARSFDASDVPASESLDALIRDLRESEARYRTLFDLVPVAAYVIDKAGVIIDFNKRAAELWGRTPTLGDTDERFCGAHRLYRADGTYMPHADTPMALIVNDLLAEFRDGEVIIERPDGSRITVIVNIRPHKNDRGEVIGAINCFYDITDRKRMEDAIRQADRNKTQFLAMLAHELRGPLSPIAASIDVLRNEKAKPSERTDETDGHALEILSRQVKHMGRLVDDLMDAARIGSGKISILPERVDLTDIARDAVDAVQPLCDSQKHELSVKLPSEAVFVNADRARVAQIVGNLLTNACKFTPSGGRIGLSVECVNRSPAESAAPLVAIRVRDSGIGIAADEVARIFDMFAQVESPLGRSASGLGIGLTLVKALTELHGGTVEVSSAGLGHGTEFVVRLPIAA